MVGSSGLEPKISLSKRDVLPLHHEPVKKMEPPEEFESSPQPYEGRLLPNYIMVAKWSQQSRTIRQPSDYKSDALPIELCWQNGANGEFRNPIYSLTKAE